MERKTIEKGRKWESCLVTNDDGPRILLRETVDILKPLFGELRIVVPSEDRIACSTALSPTGRRVKIRYEKGLAGLIVSGFPADGVRYVLNKTASEPPRVVVSGINRGHNLGLSIINSGTIGAAMEASRRGISGICLSADERTQRLTPDWKNAVRELVVKCLETLALLECGPIILNVNLPRVESPSVIQGVFLPVSQVVFDEAYDEERHDGQLTIIRRGERMLPDPTIPDLELLEGGRAVLNVVPTPWSRNLDKVVDVMRMAFPE